MKTIIASLFVSLCAARAGAAAVESVTEVRPEGPAGRAGIVAASSILSPVAPLVAPALPAAAAITAAAEAAPAADMTETAVLNASQHAAAGQTTSPAASRAALSGTVVALARTPDAEGVLEHLYTNNAASDGGPTVAAEAATSAAGRGPALAAAGNPSARRAPKTTRFSMRSEAGFVTLDALKIAKFAFFSGVMAIVSLVPAMVISLGLGKGGGVLVASEAFMTALVALGIGFLINEAKKVATYVKNLKAEPWARRSSGASIPTYAIFGTQIIAAALATHMHGTGMTLSSVLGGLMILAGLVFGHHSEGGGAIQDILLWIGSFLLAAAGFGGVALILAGVAPLGYAILSLGIAGALFAFVSAG